jgi:5-methylcytosine-specific restriction endonuclease McrA
MGRKLTFEEKRETSLRAKKEGLCRWCGLDVKRLSTKRRTFCSDECVHEFMVRSDPGYARKETYKRDKGICQICGMDCSKWFKELKKHLFPIRYNEREPVARKYFEDHGVPYVPDWAHRSTFWDVDHKVEAVVAGPCGLDNLWLLCVPCHRAKTIEFNKVHLKKKPTEELPCPKSSCSASS